MRPSCLSTLLLCFVAALTQAQSSVTTGRQYGRFLDESSALMTDAMGQPFYPQQKYNWEGKVFFPDNYTTATITSAAGKIYRNIKAKINLLDNKLLFTDSAGHEFVATIPVASVVFDEADALSPKIVFIKPKTDTASVMYQLLDSGKISLLKKISITYKDQVGYASTTVTRIFEQKYSYYTYQDGMLQPLERSKNATLALMADKKAKVETFIETEQLKLRKEDDLIAVFRFYNSL